MDEDGCRTRIVLAALVVNRKFTNAISVKLRHSSEYLLCNNFDSLRSWSIVIRNPKYTNRTLTFGLLLVFLVLHHFRFDVEYQFFCDIFC